MQASEGGQGSHLAPHSRGEESQVAGSGPSSRPASTWSLWLLDSSDYSRLSSLGAGGDSDCLRTLVRVKVLPYVKHSGLARG